MPAIGSRKSAAAKKSKKSSTRARAVAVNAWEDDPMSGAKAESFPAPQLASAVYGLKIAGAAPPPGDYAETTAAFRYWNAAVATRRAADFWGGIVPRGTRWQPGATLTVNLDVGEDLNAYYDRKGLSFFHESVSGRTVYSGESADVLCHELGHAVLDSVRPELWDAAADEVASFHESFGDMSAILSDLQIPDFRSAALKETGGQLYRSSRLSRLAEQLGWAIRQQHPDLVDPDCLRNAVNSFFYRAPDTLPPDGPASILTSEPHSFSRVFTGGFFEAFAGMTLARAPRPTSNDLQATSSDAGRLLIDAVIAAPVVPDYYSQVASGMIHADADRFRGRYKDALQSAFVRRGLLSVQAAVALRETGSASRKRPARGRRVAAPSPTGPSGTLMAIAGAPYGLGDRALLVQPANQARRFQASAAALDVGTAAPPAAEKAARSFVEDLFRRGRVDLQGLRLDAPVLHSRAHKTHALVPQGNALRLVRRCFAECLTDRKSRA